MTRRFDTLLVANRGEIALRILRTARRLGLRTVAVYSDADRHSPHLAHADLACRLGPAPARESYLCIERLIDAASASGAQAVHPGYGFLAENASFAAAVQAAGLVFVGPPAQAIELMGNKAAAKVRMAAAGVPCIAGWQGVADEAPDDAALVREAMRIGFPVMVKAAAGGGGRGMRRVAKADDLPEALAMARSEAMAAFGSGQLILERAIDQARHIEIQVFADEHGSVIHLGERDCSVQRRHQKLIEEAPSPAVDAALREAMGAVAVAATRAIGYRGAGTLEFLLEPDGRFWFMEMNTRLQVEHGVTELVTGLDLVEWQLRVAQGEPLPLTQDQVRWQGHAMELRLCAEDPSRDFLPQLGEVLAWEAPPGVRADAALAAGVVVAPDYDSMLGKVMAHGASRAECIDRLVAAAQRTVLLGVRHNLAFLTACLRDPVFAEGAATTAFIEQRFGPASRQAQPPSQVARLAAVLLFSRAASEGAWTNALGLGARVELESQGMDRTEYQVTHEWVAVTHDRVAVTHERTTGTRERSVQVTPRVDGHEAEPVRVHRLVQQADLLSFELDAMTHRVRYAFAGDGALWLHAQGCQFVFRDEIHRHGTAAGPRTAVAGELRAPLAGRVVRVPFQAGAQVGQGDTLVVIESMKMEHALIAPFAGELAELNASVGDQVVAGRVLARVLPRELESALGSAGAPALGSARAPVLSPDLNAVPGDRAATD